MILFFALLPAMTLSILTSDQIKDGSLVQIYSQQHSSYLDVDRRMLFSFNGSNFLKYNGWSFTGSSSSTILKIHYFQGGPYFFISTYPDNLYFFLDVHRCYDYECAIYNLSLASFSDFNNSLSQNTQNVNPLDGMCKNLNSFYYCYLNDADQYYHPYVPALDKFLFLAQFPSNPANDLDKVSFMLINKYYSNRCLSYASAFHLNCDANNLDFFFSFMPGLQIATIKVSFSQSQNQDRIRVVWSNPQNCSNVVYVIAPPLVANHRFDPSNFFCSSLKNASLFQAGIDSTGIPFISIELSSIDFQNCGCLRNEDYYVVRFYADLVIFDLTADYGISDTLVINYARFTSIVLTYYLDTNGSNSSNSSNSTDTGGNVAKRDQNYQTIDITNKISFSAAAGVISGKYLKNELQKFEFVMNLNSSYNLSIMNSNVFLTTGGNTSYFSCTYNQTAKNQLSVFVDLSTAKSGYYDFTFQILFVMISNNRRILEVSTNDFVSNYQTEKPFFVGTQVEIDNLISIENSGKTQSSDFFDDRDKIIIISLSVFIIVGVLLCVIGVVVY